MADLTQAELERELPLAYERGRNYVRHVEQLNEGKRGAQVTCGGCALDGPLTTRPTTNQAAPAANS